MNFIYKYNILKYLIKKLKNYFRYINLNTFSYHFFFFFLFILNFYEFEKYIYKNKK